MSHASEWHLPPWTEQEVVNVNEFQRAAMHPFTCGCGPVDDDFYDWPNRDFVARIDGLHCPNGRCPVQTTHVDRGITDGSLLRSIQLSERRARIKDWRRGDALEVALRSDNVPDFVKALTNPFPGADHRVRISTNDVDIDFEGDFEIGLLEERNRDWDEAYVYVSSLVAGFFGRISWETCAAVAASITGRASIVPPVLLTDADTEKTVTVYFTNPEHGRAERPTYLGSSTRTKP